MSLCFSFRLFICFNLGLQIGHSVNKLFVFEYMLLRNSFDPCSHDASFVRSERLSFIVVVKFQFNALLSFETFAWVEVRHATKGVFLGFQQSRNLLRVLISPPFLRGNRSNKCAIVI